MKNELLESPGGEISKGPMTHITFDKFGGNKIPSSEMENLIGKKIQRNPNDPYYYIRNIGGEPHEKVGWGHPKK